MGDSTRDTLTAAWDAAEAPDTAATPAPVAETPAVTATPEAGPVVDGSPLPAEGTESVAAKDGRDEKGRFAPKAGAPATTVAPIKPADKSAAPAPAAAAITPPVTGEAELKAPASLRLTARADWEKTPRAVQEEFVRREKETSVAMQRASEASRQWDAFREAVGPYEAHIRALGAHPVQAAANLFQTEAGLRLGTPQQKADLAVRLIRGYDIPLDAINAALERGPSQTANAPAAPAQFRDPRVDELFAEREREREASIADLTGHMESKEFWRQVEPDVVDMVAIAQRRKQPITKEFLDAAYTKACKLNEEVSGYLEQRAKAAAAPVAAAATQRAMAAASSVKSQPSGVAANGVPDRATDTVRAVWDSMSGR